jgi:hypothetical protein
MAYGVGLPTLKKEYHITKGVWLWVKTLAPNEPQHSWYSWMFIPLKLIEQS